MQVGWLLLVAVLLFFSTETMDTGYRAAQVFASSVLPALFPMMVVGGLMSGGNSKNRPERFLVMWLITFGFCAGSPASARQLCALHQQRPLTGKQCRPLLCMTGVMSPLFFTGTLASRLGQGDGLRLLVCHWLAALATGLVCWAWQRKYKESPDCPAAGGSCPAPPPRGSLPDRLPAAISGAAQALLSVLGAMMVFAIVAAVLRALLARLWPDWTRAHQPMLAVLWALLEIGGGSLSVLDSFAAPPLALLCALCSFGGLSIWMQNLLFVGQMIHPAELLGWRLLHGALGYGFCWLTTLFWGPAAPAAAQAGQGLAQAAPPWAPLWLALSLLLIPAFLPSLRAHPSS